MQFIPLNKSGPYAATVFFAQLFAVCDEGFRLLLLALMARIHRLKDEKFKLKMYKIRKEVVIKKNNPLDIELLKHEIFFNVLDKMILKSGRNLNNLKRSPVVKGLSLEWISKNKETFIKKIHQAIQQDDFEFSALKKTRLKIGDKTRDIFISHYADRMLLTAIHDITANAMSEFYSENLYSFRKGYGPKKAAIKLAQYLKENSKTCERFYFIGRDITSYGDSINHQVMDNVLNSTPQLQNSQLVLKLLKKTYRCEYYNEDNPGIRASLLKGIPSGSPVVPLLENLYLSSIDKKLESIKNCFYARYGDDFIFISTNEKQALEAIDLIDSLVHDLGLQISEQKIKNIIIGKSAQLKDFHYKTYFEWIGITFYPNGRFSFRPKHKKQYKQKLRQDIGNVCFHLNKSTLNEKEKTECINIGLNELNDLQHTPEIQKLIVLRTHINNMKRLDLESRLFLVRTICKTFKVKRREAWKLLRGMKKNSLEYQRRKMKCNRPT